MSANDLVLKGDTAATLATFGATPARIVAVAILPVFSLVAVATLANRGAADLRTTCLGICEEKMPTPFPMAVLAMIGITIAVPICLTYSPWAI